ncbi:hypothetical protein ACVWXO_000296 [Bradyrhizobium sp. LM2.7]
MNEKHASHQMNMRKLLEQRHIKVQYADEKISAASIVRAYRHETERQQLIAERADLTHALLVFVINALKTLMSERIFSSFCARKGLTSCASRFCGG